MSTPATSVVTPASARKRMGDDEVQEQNDGKKPKIDRQLSFTTSHFDPKINAFLTFRRHIACIHRFNVYKNSLKIQYEKNIYLRPRGDHKYDIFLPVPQDPDNSMLLRAYYESIVNDHIFNQHAESVTFNITSVYDDHLKRITKKENNDIQTWFENSKRSPDEVAKRKLQDGLTPTTLILKNRIFNPLQFTTIKKEV